MRNFMKPWLTSLLFLVVMLAIYPTVDRFEFDEDEGINLIKGALVAEGHSLYDDIWSDQPPLLTQAFAAVFRLGGPGVESGRFLVLAFAVLLVWSLQRIASLLGGPACAVVGLLILVTVPGLAKLSVSAMVGLPSISLALAALAAQLVWHRDMKNRWLVVAGALLGMSILTKLFTLFLLPIFLGGIFVGRVGDFRQKSISVAYWLAGFLGVGGTLAAMWLEPAALGQLIDPHVDAKSVVIYQGQHWFRGFQENSALLVLAGIGAVVQLRRRRWLWLYPALWMLFALVILLTHTPVWYHQRLLVTVPAVPLAAWVSVDTFRTLHRRSSVKEFLVPALVFVLLGLAAGQHWPGLSLLLKSGDRGEASRISSEEIVQDMGNNAKGSDWVVTDRPIYAFRAGLLVPPPVAVLTGKRLRTGRINEDMLMRAVEDFQAREILLARFEWDTLPERLAAGFNSTTYSDRRVLFVRTEPRQ